MGYITCLPFAIRQGYSADLPLHKYSSTGLYGGCFTFSGKRNTCEQTQVQCTWIDHLVFHDTNSNRIHPFRLEHAGLSGNNTAVPGSGCLAHHSFSIKYEMK